VLRHGQHPSEVLSVAWKQRHLAQQQQLQLQKPTRSGTDISGTHGVLLSGEHLLRRHRRRQGPASALHPVHRAGTTALRSELLQAGPSLRKREPFALLQNWRDPVRWDVLSAELMRKSNQGLLQARSDRGLRGEEVLPREPSVLGREVPLHKWLAEMRT
jgi:hypothetical protein